MVVRNPRIRASILTVALICFAAAAPSQSSDAGPTFTVTPPKGSWTLIAYGDMRFTDPADRVDSNPVARQALVRRIAEEKPNVLLLSGDLPFHGGDADDYAVYQAETQVWRQEGIRIFPALGNHELYDPRERNGCAHCLENWWNTFPELRGRRWYSVHFGEAYIITLDSNSELAAGSVQGQWLARQLKELPDGVRYVFISLHHPPIADPVRFDNWHNARPNEQALAQQLETAASQTKARIVVAAGHIHNYERFQHGGVDYLVSGGGGARPYQVDRTPRDLYQERVFPIFHYVKFVSDGGKLRATMYRLDNERLEKVRLDDIQLGVLQLDKGSFIAADSFTVGEGVAVSASVRERWFDLSARIRWALVCLEQLIDDSHQFLGIGRLLQI